MLKSTIKKIILCSLFCLGIMSSAIAQTDTTKKQNKEDEEGAADPAGGSTDLSQFQGEVQEATGTKRYCTSKIFGISPTKLISIGYDYQLGYKMTTSDVQPDGKTTNEQTENVSRTHDLRFLANFPVVSNNKITVNIGASYMESHYAFENKNITATSNRLPNSLQNNALRSANVNFTVFKPLNIKTFLLFNTQHEVNGDYDLTQWQPLGYMKHSITALYGWKKSDRLQYGFGVARTYRAGELNYIPVILYNFTAENRKWGIEALFPARVHYRRTFNPRSILLLGYELEGNSYRLQNRNNEFGANNKDVELRRSELRMRAVYERQLSGFIWLSVQAGYRYNFRYQVDNGDFYRGLGGDQLYVMKNTLTNPLYFNISLNLVSP